MRKALWLVVLVGCASDPAEPTPGLPPPPAPLPTPTDAACAADVTLTPDGTLMASQTVPVTVDTAGLALCLHLDATMLARPHFLAAMPAQPSTMSAFSTALLDADNQLIVDGWDVTVGQTDPQTSAHLEWAPPGGEVTTVRLWVQSRAGPASTSVEVTLFDPLE
jgi:hypothetical protein